MKMGEWLRSISSVQSYNETKSGAERVSTLRPADRSVPAVA